MSFAIPVHRLRETDSLIAFHHPKPTYPLHILLVPKKAITDLTALDPSDTGFLSDLISTVQDLVAEFNLGQVGYRLITNGGQYQDIPQLHFHLISDNPVKSSPSESSESNNIHKT
jgi:histidine triad (HIT) family protein